MFLKMFKQLQQHVNTYNIPVKGISPLLCLHKQCIHVPTMLFHSLITWVNVLRTSHDLDTYLGRNQIGIATTVLKIYFSCGSASTYPFHVRAAIMLLHSLISLVNVSSASHYDICQRLRGRKIWMCPGGATQNLPLQAQRAAWEGY